MGCTLHVGLTGGIGSGKSEVSRYFSELGVPVIDTDVIARELVEPGQPALSEIVDTFGKDIIDQDGNLDRARLRHRIFSDPAERKKLEAILHPRIRARTMELLDRTSADYCVLVIPLLAEAAPDYPLDRILVIDTPPELQRQRVAARDGLNDNEIAAIMRSQANRERRLQMADDVLLNDGTIEELRAQIDQLHQKYLRLAADQLPVG